VEQEKEQRARLNLDEIGLPVQGLVAERHTSLNSPRQVARFLCGLRSPAASRARLTRHDCFGLLEHLPFGDVLACAESLNLG